MQHPRQQPKSNFCRVFFNNPSNERKSDPFFLCLMLYLQQQNLFYNQSTKNVKLISKSSLLSGLFVFPSTFFRNIKLGEKKKKKDRTRQLQRALSMYT